MDVLGNVHTDDQKLIPYFAFSRIVATYPPAQFKRDFCANFVTESLFNGASEDLKNRLMRALKMDLQGLAMENIGGIYTEISHFITHTHTHNLVLRGR